MERKEFKIFFAEEQVPENIVGVWNAAKAEFGAKYDFDKKGQADNGFECIGVCDYAG